MGLSAQKLCIVVHRKDLVKLSSPPLQLTFNKWKTKKLQKSETCLFVDVSALTKINVWVAVKAKTLPYWIFENVPNENCSLLT